ncbi:MAG TPA: hypothetical protein VFO55_10545 [Gemmatimonadaceae bacterium]|nr:hypothetical protein [Gemmatimonadaceae bacterium]
MRRHPEAYLVARRLLLGGLLFIVSGCGRKHYLAEYQFADKSLALSFVDPPSPELRTGLYDLRPSTNPITTVMRAGGGIAKEIEARKASARLDSATRRVDIPARLAQRTLERTALYLGARPVQSPRDADYVIEINMRRFGIDARSSHAAYLYTRAEAVLIDRRTGREIWSVDIHGNDRMTPWVIGTRTVPSSIFTAIGIHNVSVADFQEALEQLVTSSSNAITNQLRDKLRDVRDP